MPILEVEHISKSFNKTPVYYNIFMVNIPYSQ